MSNVMDFLDSEAGLSIAAFVVATVWSLVQGSKWYTEHVAARYEQVIMAIQSGVVETYHTYVEGVKAGNSDGKLTPEEREKARNLAVGKAREILLAKGVQINEIMPPAEVALWVERGVTALKQGRGEKKA